MQTTTTPALRRRIGVAGTVARIALGLWMLGSVLAGHWSGPSNPAAWFLGLVGFPALSVGWQAWRARRDAAPLRAIGPVAHVVNIVIFFVLWTAPWYAPSIGFVSDAALLFYGSSMLLAAWRGYHGCEVLAISNWLLGRDDQIGCLLFGPVDHLEGHGSSAAP